SQVLWVPLVSSRQVSGLREGHKKRLPWVGRGQGRPAIGPINLERGDLRASILGVARCAGMPDVLWKSPEPAAVDFSCLFERNDPHLPPSVTELFPGEPVRRTAFFDERCRRGSVR